jgi:hypothetical protein
MNETYFEHAYLARYLGFLLVEGEDLTVRDNGLFIRTVSGLKRTEVLLRRLDADFSDPLELNARSRLGVPGLVQAVRDGKVVIANGLGSGLAEARGMLAFLPALSETIDGRPLAVPNIATWWLGDPAVHAAMRERFDDMVVASAYAGELPRENIGDGVRGSELGLVRRRRILQAIEDRGIDIVLQEAVRLSTMPVWRNGKLEPRPFILRVFLARHGDSFAVMPGGFLPRPRWPRPPCSRARTASRSSALPARCRAAPPTTCSGSAATWSAPRRRCGWCALCWRGSRKVTGRSKTSSPSPRFCSRGKRCRTTLRPRGRWRSRERRCSAPTSPARRRRSPAPPGLPVR